MTKYTSVRFASIILLAALSPAVDAEISISQYEQFKDDKGLRFYMQGVANGLSLANSKLEVAGGPRLYCAPRDYLPTVEDTMQLVDRHVGEVRNDTAFLAQSPNAQANYPMPLVLMFALETEYPCKDEQGAEKRAARSPGPAQQAAPLIQSAPVYQPPPLPAMPSVPFPSGPGRTTTICRTLSNGTVVCD